CELIGEDERAATAYARAGDAAPARKRAEAAFRAGKLREARNAAIEALVESPRDRETLGWAVHERSPAAMWALVDGLVPAVAAAAGLAGELAARLGGSDDERLALERAAQLYPTPLLLVALGDRARGAAAAARYEEALALDAGCAPAALGLAREGEPQAAARA